MASISTENGTKILYYELDGTKKITLGKITQHAALTIKAYVEDLISAKILGVSPKQETAVWLSKIDDKLYLRLLKKELVESRTRRENPTVEESVRRYQEHKKRQLKSSTYKTITNTYTKFLARVPRTKRLSFFTRDNAKDFVNTLQGCENTRNKCIKHLKQLFSWAVSEGLTASNPFSQFATPDAVNEKRNVEIPRETFYQIIGHCPDYEFAFLIACYRILICRFAEPFLLTIGDIDLDNAEIRVPCPKTAYRGKSERFVPIFPEFKPFLTELLKQRSNEAETLLIQKWQKKPAIIRKHYLRVLTAAKLGQYSRLFNNHRSTRITELLKAGFSIKSVAAWSGNSPEIILKHYAQITDEEKQRAKTLSTGFAPAEASDLRLVI
jgi:integrase